MAEYETLAEGAEPPGRWVEREGGLRKWKGQVAWRVTRGDAVVTVELGRWAAVEGATLPDGSPAGHLRAAVRNLFDGGDLWHATREGVTEVTHGRVVARDDGVTFVPDAVQPGPRRDWSDEGGPDLRDALAADPDFLAEVARDDFATATYLAFENRGYVRVADGRRFAMTFRAAGAFVAEVRGIGEDYLAFYCSRHAPSDAASGEATRLDAAVRDAIARVGWRPETREGTGD